MTSLARMPAEWEPQSAVMLTWPHHGTDWKSRFNEVEQTYFEIAEAVLASQNLLISCEDDAILEAIHTRLQPLSDAHGTRLFLYQVPANDTWARDHGPITVIENNQPVLLDFNFNAWGDKFASDKDNLLNRRLQAQSAFGSNAMRQIDFILEGGSIESNGEGVLLTTKHCLMQTSRNARLSQREIELALKTHLGAEKLLWLGSGYLEGDDTDAHIDTLARFITSDTICYVQCDDPNDSHYEALGRMHKELEQFRNTDGTPFKLIPLPMASAIEEDGERLPATYANFLIINQSVLLPVYQVPEDQQAIAVLQDCFPDRNIIPIDCRSLITQHGSLHCVTMQLAKGVCK